MSDNSTQVSGGVPQTDPPEKRGNRRSILFLLIVVALCLCTTVGVASANGGLFNFLNPTPPPTEAATDEPTATVEVTETDVVPTDEPTPLVTEELTKEATEPPTVEATDETCTVVVGDGVCDTRCENTDLDSSSCTCNQNSICEPGEGTNCPDCSYGQCGQGCGSDADCHNPGLSCTGGVCGGPSCPSGGGDGCACRCIRPDPRTGKCQPNGGLDCHGNRCTP